VKIKPPFPYYGGKSKLQHEIQVLIPAYHVYAEPFAGAASTLFNLENFHNKVEILNDMNKELINFYKTVRDKNLFPQLLAMVEGTLHSEADYRRSLEVYLNPHGHSRVLRAWAMWVAFTQSHVSDPHKGSGWRFEKKETRGGFNKEALGIHSSKRNFKKLAGRLERVSFTCRDALDFIKRVDTPDTFFFVDPPYPGSDQGNFEKMGFKMPQFLELLELLESIQGRFLLTSGLYPELEAARIKNGWHSKDIGFNNAVTIWNGKENKSKIVKRIEAMTWNYQEPNGRLF
jgi:DNA adenine methylase